MPTTTKSSLNWLLLPKPPTTLWFLANFLVKSFLFNFKEAYILSFYSFNRMVNIIKRFLKCLVTDQSAVKLLSFWQVIEEPWRRRISSCHFQYAYFFIIIIIIVVIDRQSGIQYIHVPLTLESVTSLIELYSLEGRNHMLDIIVVKHLIVVGWRLWESGPAQGTPQFHPLLFQQNRDIAGCDNQILWRVFVGNQNKERAALLQRGGGESFGEFYSRWAFPFENNSRGFPWQLTAIFLLSPSWNVSTSRSYELPRNRAFVFWHWKSIKPVHWPVQTPRKRCSKCEVCD